MSRSPFRTRLLRVLSALLGAAALAPGAAATPSPREDASRPAIERVEAIRSALRARDAALGAEKDATASERHAQWLNWPNWNNWANWNNWPNWGNWLNW